MNWITEKQAAEAAKQGKIPALEWSLLHWQQPGMVGYVELAEAMKSGEFEVGQGVCACCHRYNNLSCKDKNSDTCPFRLRTSVEHNYCCDNKWKIADNTYDNCIKNNYSNAIMQAFQDAAAELCKFIADVLEKEKAKEKKKCEPELVPRAYGYATFSRCFSTISMPVKFMVDCDGVLRYPEQVEICTHATQPLPKDTKVCVLGNLIDDLKRNSEDLWEFEVDRFRVRLGKNIIHTEAFCKDRAFTIEEAVRIHQKLGQIIAFVKRQENKK